MYKRPNSHNRSQSPISHPPSAKPPPNPLTSSTTIRVNVRLKPFTPSEIKRNERECVNPIDENHLMLSSSHSDIHRKQTQFEFHGIIEKTASQQEVYNRSFRPLLPGLLSGLNTTIFAYGSTGSGKTYTIQGNKENPGIVSHIVSDLYSLKDEQPEKLITYKFSYIEVYNENLHDLLTSVDKPVDIREDPQKGIQLVGVPDILANNRKELMTMVNIGNRNRTQEPTARNEFSSRSHSVLQVLVETYDKTQGIDNNLHVSKLIICDLAGSEKSQIKTGHANRHQEGANINKS